MTRKPVRLLVADVDGTLVTSNKKLTDAAIAAVAALRSAGVCFSLTSGRPTKGMAMLIDPLGTPLRWLPTMGACSLARQDGDRPTRWSSQ